MFHSQGFGLEYSELREYTHGFFSNIAEILADGFAQVWIYIIYFCGFILPIFMGEYLCW